MGERAGESERERERAGEEIAGGGRESGIEREREGDGKKENERV